MEDARTTNVGVAARACERLAIRLALSGHLPRVTTNVVDRLCTRCATSGRCITDACDSFAAGSDAAEDLGCPGWCELLSHLEPTRGDAEASARVDAIPF